jgi:hypothetical protein
MVFKFSLPIACLYAWMAAVVFFSSINSWPISVQADKYRGLSFKALWKYSTAFSCCCRSE